MHTTIVVSASTTNLVGTATTDVVRFQPMSTLEIRLKEAMDEAGVGQSELARRASTDRASVKQQNIQHILSGRDKKSKHTAALARVLGVNFEWLAEGLGPKRARDSAAGTSHGEAISAEPPPRIVLPVELPNEAQLTEMFVALLKTVGRPDLEGKLARKLAQHLPDALEQSIIRHAPKQSGAKNIRGENAQPPAKRRVAPRQQQRT